MARRLFDPNSMVWRPLGVLGDLVMLSLLWTLCCIPIVTAGSSTAALYDAAVHVLRRRDAQLFSRFFSTFRRELKSGVLSTLLWLAILFAVWLLCAGLRRLLPESAQALVLIPCLVLVSFFLLCVLCWVFPTLSRFTFGTLALNAACLRLAFGHILRSVAMALVTALGAALCYALALPIMVVPALVALFCSWLLEPVFRRYEEPEEEKEA